MARARNIKPGFFRNSDLVDLPVEARLLFIGLWTIADRDGRLNDKPKQIKMEIYPGDSFDVDSLLQKLHDSKFIQRYEVNNIKYIHILNFVKHQNPHIKEQDSDIPKPVISGASPVQLQDKPVVCTEVATLNPSSLNPESLLLNPESLKRIPEKKPTVANAPPFLLPDWINSEDWNLWLKTRKGKKMISEQMQAQIKKLDRWRSAGLDYGKALNDAAAS